MHFQKSVHFGSNEVVNLWSAKVDFTHADDADDDDDDGAPFVQNSPESVESPTFNQ